MTCIVLRDAAHPQTPNLGQGGCVGLEDTVVLAQAVASAAPSTAGSYTSQPLAFKASLEGALRGYEHKRSARCLPLTMRANIMGALLQLPFEPVSSMPVPAQEHGHRHQGRTLGDLLALHQGAATGTGPPLWSSSSE